MPGVFISFFVVCDWSIIIYALKLELNITHRLDIARMQRWSEHGHDSWRHCPRQSRWLIVVCVIIMIYLRSDFRRRDTRGHLENTIHRSRSHCCSTPTPGRDTVTRSSSSYQRPRDRLSTDGQCIYFVDDDGCSFDDPRWSSDHQTGRHGHAEN